MAKRRNKTPQADHFDPYSAQRYLQGRKSHLAGAGHPGGRGKPGMGSGWIAVIAGLFVLAVVMVVVS